MKWRQKDRQTDFQELYINIPLFSHEELATQAKHMCRANDPPRRNRERAEQVLVPHQNRQTTNRFQWNTRNSADDETENSKHGTEHDNGTTSEKKEFSLSLSLFSPKDLLFLCGRNNAGQRHAEHTKSKTISREGDV